MQKKNNLRRLLSGRAVLSSHAMIRAVGGLTRYRIIVLLDAHPSGLSATDLTEVFDASPSMISHQLGLLRRHGLIVGDKGSQRVTYRLNQGLARRFLPPT